MDKNAIKKYAVWARRELIERVSQRAMLYGISEQDAGDPSAESVNGHLLSQAEKRQRQALIRNIKQKGYTQVMEEAAYTWFNRFAALRFMEVNGYLPSHVRVFTNDAGEFKPQILAEAIHMELDGLDMDKVYELESANRREELYKYLLITQCNALAGILPGMFQRIDDYTELLFPDNLLRKGSVIEQMVTTIPEEDWTDQVQIIGWLYQYYNTEPKDKVFADLKKNIKITKEKIPAATQLFTPDWIVRYMVENSLGRLWVEGHPSARDKYLPAHNADGSVHVEEGKWNYYLEEAAQEPEVEAQLAIIRKEYAGLKPEDIRVIDPCCGSGHILCVLFDVLVQIYEDYGYTAREAAQKIVQHNLYGLDIDPRAVQLSNFAVMMKARQYDRLFFRRNIQPMVYSPEGYPEGLEYGSLITVDELEPAPDFENWTLQDGDYNLAQNRWSFRYVLSQKYHVVVTNPPYMGNSSMSAKLLDYLKEYYPDSKSDMFAVFIERCKDMTSRNGFQTMITQHAWMSLATYEKLRNKLHDMLIINMAHLGPKAFEEVSGEMVQTTSFVLQNTRINQYIGKYCRLVDSQTALGKEKLFLSKAYQYCAKQDSFERIPGAPVSAYVAGDTLAIVYEKGKTIKDIGEVKIGMGTGNNDLFLKLWWEIEKESIDYSMTDASRINKLSKKYYPYSKGGDRKRWYGNHEYVVWYDINGQEQMRLTSGHRENGGYDYYFHKGMTWTYSTMAAFCARIMPRGFVFDVNGSSLFLPEELFNYILCFLQSCVGRFIIESTKSAFSIQAGTIRNLPVIGETTAEIEELANACIIISRDDWDSFETSWGFQCHPLISMISKGGQFFEIGNIDLAECYMLWEAECNERFRQLKANEEELNRIFIDIYGLQNELTPEVDDKDVTLRKADLQREVKSLISYAVGCMFGRYSLQKPGLVYAGGDFQESFRQKMVLAVDSTGSYAVDLNGEMARALDDEYSEINLDGRWIDAQFCPDKDNIIPICDDEYFSDDIVGRFVEFVRVVFGEKSLETNLSFIAHALGGKGSPREVIRNYFLNGFYADHLTIYQKRPIYWLFDSGKKNGFKCLIYMHRYQPDTIARIRTDYVHEQQSRYRTAIADLEQRMNGASTSERVKLSKQLTKLKDQAEELRLYEEKIHHLADQMIKIDLDDGVKHNYAIFQDVLAKIK